MKQSSMEEKPAPLRRGYTHDHMLGMDQKSNPAWVDELKKIRTLKPMRITELIGRFDRRPSAPANEAVTSEEMAFLKQKRRGSLQIHLDPSDMGKFEIWYTMRINLPKLLDLLTFCIPYFHE